MKASYLYVILLSVLLIGILITNLVLNNFGTPIFNKNEYVLSYNENETNNNIANEINEIDSKDDGVVELISDEENYADGSGTAREYFDVSAPSVLKSSEKITISENETPLVVIVIDDCGMPSAFEESFLNISTNITFAVLPGHERSVQFNKRAIALGYETIIHVPMEAQNPELVPLEKHIIWTTNSAKDQTKLLKKFYNELPGTKGINNHQGSKATSDKKTMDNVLNFCRDNHFYFFDSRTTKDSIAYTTALRKGVATAERHVFLDNADSKALVRSNVHTLIKIAKEQGVAIGIGHFTKESTALVLKEEVPNFNRYGVKLVKLSEVLVN